MEWDEIAANWPALVPSIRTRWPDADDDTVLAMDGDRDALIAYVSRIEAVPEVEAQDQVAAWAETAMPADARMEPVMDNANISRSGEELPPGEAPLDADEAFGDEAAETGRTEPDPPLGRNG